MFQNYKQQIEAIVTGMRFAPTVAARDAAFAILDGINPCELQIQHVLRDAVQAMKSRCHGFSVNRQFLWSVVKCWDLIFMDPGTTPQAIADIIDEYALRIFSRECAVVLSMEAMFNPKAKLSAASEVLLREGRLLIAELHKEPESQNDNATNAPPEDDKTTACAACAEKCAFAQPTKAPTKVSVRRKACGGNPVDEGVAPLKTYKVNVAQTHYGEITVQAHNEEEALAIAQGNQKMHNGHDAVQHFKPTSHDTYLTLCEDDGEIIKEV